MSDSPSFHSFTIQTHHAAGAMGILETFGLNKFSNAFKKPGGVYRPWNLLTLEPNLHNKFDHLELWFEHIRRVCHPEA